MSVRKTWDPDRMKADVTDVRKSFETSSVFRVPQTTLQRYAKHDSNFANRTETKLDSKPVLLPSLKEDAVDHCLNMGKCFFGLAMHDVRL
jgi:hypothetical protein